MSIHTTGFRRRLRPVLALTLLLAALGMSACGKKGPPELPEGQHDQYPRQYPNPDEL